MTISGVPAGSTYTQTFTTTEARLAALVLNNEDQQQAIDQQIMAQARHRYIEASRAEVEAIRDEADHIFQGAMIHAGVSLAGAGLQLLAVKVEGAATIEAANAECDLVKASELADCKTWSTVRAVGESASNGLSPALSKALGDSRAVDDRADAKDSANDAKQAEWALDDRRNAIRGSLRSRSRRSNGYPTWSTGTPLPRARCFPIWRDVFGTTARN